MKITWLENCDIRPEVRASIYQDIEKVANVANVDPLMAQAGKQLTTLIGSLLTAGAVMTGGLTAKGILDRRNEKNTMNNLRSQIGQNKQEIASGFSSDDKAKAMARFDEIAQIAPSITLNKALTQRLVQDNLHSGLSSATVNHLALLQAKFMPNMQIVQDLNKTAAFKQVRPEVLGDILADVCIIKIASTIGKGVQEITKSVSKGQNILKSDFMGRAKDLAIISSIPFILNSLGGVANMISSKLDQKKLEKNLKESYNTALSGDSDNAKILTENPEAANNAFKTLTHFAPGVAVDPNAARGFMAKMVAYGQGGSDISDLKALTEVQKNMSSSSNPNAFAEGFSAVPSILKPMMDIGGSNLMTSNQSSSESWKTPDVDPKEFIL